MLPYEYPEHFDVRFYNEQYVRGAYLLGASNWEILAPVHYLRQKEILPTGGASFRMRPWRVIPGVANSPNGFTESSGVLTKDHSSTLICNCLLADREPSWAMLRR